MDENREADGLSMRDQFAYENNLEEREAEEALSGECSMLEMMVGLALRCENVMEDPQYGNDAYYWFWQMIGNLGLHDMADDRFDPGYFESVIERFLDRDYDRDGNGGLFVVNKPRHDMRTVDIWCQANWAMTELAEKEGLTEL